MEPFEAIVNSFYQLKIFVILPSSMTSSSLTDFTSLSASERLFLVFKKHVRLIAPYITRNTAQNMKFSIKDFFSKCDQIRRKLRIWSHLLDKFLMGNFIFCAVKPFQIVTNFICKCFWVTLRYNLLFKVPLIKKWNFMN